MVLLQPPLLFVDAAAEADMALKIMFSDYLLPFPAVVSSSVHHPNCVEREICFLAILYL
jgi:hypothetical protein